MSTYSASRTAYILTIHKNPVQVNKFVKQVVSEGNADVFIHIDRKNYKELHSKLIPHANVIILKESIDVKWGDITLVDATNLLIKEVLKTGRNYNFVCLRSGQDLLVRSGFKEFLLNNPQKIFMNAYFVDKKDAHAAFANVSWPQSTRRLYINPFHPNRLFRRAIQSLYGLGINLFPNPHMLPQDFCIYNGSNWFCIPLEVAKYIIKFIEENNWYYKSFENSLCPDEFFYQTLIMNSHYKSDVVDNNLMYIKFGETLKSRNNPITLKMEHIETIRDSNKFFARKFDEKEDLKVIEYFEKSVKM
ncbi:beta-1,6-N-acetylglucosaminyltransferase [Neobacillus vireti]|uniref:beta-1,6-N-acetylglucosaminyltransferase n=1 Tax=Neobacillus vireti TaxID=220686 RepID=UPI002FFDA3A0